MGFDKIETPLRIDLFIEKIQNMILSGELKQGDKLPASRELVEKMGVSRNVIDSGLQKLEQMGFVEVIPKIGTYVADYRRKGTLETLVAMANYHDGLMNSEVIRSIMEVRTPLESLCVELVIDRITDDEIKALERLLEQIKDNVDAGELALANAVFRFHHELSVYSGNRLLPLLYYSFKETGIQLWKAYAVSEGGMQLYENKRALLEAIKNRNFEKAIIFTPGEYPRSSKEYMWP